MEAFNGAVLLLVAAWFAAMTLEAIVASPTYAELGD